MKVSYESPGVRGEARPTAAEGEETKGVFLTPQSLATFPVATFVIGLVWKISTTLIPELGGSLWFPLFLSFLMGGFIYYVGVTDPDSKFTSREINIARVVAVVNSFYLFGATTGIATAVGVT